MFSFKKICWNPYFYSVLGCALFGPSCQKREILDTHPKKGKIWLITEKLIFEYFLVFIFFCFSFLFFFCFVVFVFFGGFKGALNPLICFFGLFFFLVPFPFFVVNRKALFPPQEWHFLFIFECPPFFLHRLFWPPPFSLVLSLSLFFSFLPSFLSFFFAFFWFLVFVAFFLLVSSLLLFHERNNIKIFNYKGIVHQSFLMFVGFLSSFFFQIPFPYLCFFPAFKFCFSTSMFFFKKCKFKKHQFGVKRGVAT